LTRAPEVRSRSPGGRIVALDIARSLALLGMAVFHLTYDLQLFGHLPPGTVFQHGWRMLSVVVAGSFLFLSGISLVLAHGQGIRWRAFLRRLVLVGGAAALVSLGTYAAFPDRFVYFGILHSIAAASVVGLAFLRSPAPVTALAAVGAFLAPRWLGGVTDLGWLDWTGLTDTIRPTVDFEPLFPWLAPFLMGMALARVAGRAGLWHRLRQAPGAGTPILRALAWPGRHSLAVYLIHQPVLLALVWGWTQVAGAPPA